MSSFDESIGKYILEKGCYTISIRSDAHTVLDSVTFEIEEEIIYEGTTCLFKQASTPTITRLFNENHAAFTGPDEKDFIASQELLDSLEVQYPDFGVQAAQSPIINKNYNLKLKDMVNVEKEDERWQKFVEQLSVSELCALIGNGAWQTKGIKRLGVPRTLSPDGSCSISATIFSAVLMGNRKTGITWPSPAVLAAGFNPELAYKMGECVGNEGKAMGYSGWYAPALNLHRTPYNSRNFEYYSEDPILTGKIGASVVKGAQDQKLNVYIKHFALNERETNTRNQLFTFCSEQAMRELYLKPFELSVKEGGAMGAMSSFNYIGHIWAGGSKELLTDLLRKEWGFKGMVITDACMYPHMNPIQMLSAGGDLCLDALGQLIGENGKSKELMKAAGNPDTGKQVICMMQSAAKNILYAVSKTL